MLRMKQRVRILEGQNNLVGTIIGIELVESRVWLGFMNEKEYVDRHDVPRYKVAYISSSGDRAFTEWYYEKQLEKYTKTKK